MLQKTIAKLGCVPAKYVFLSIGPDHEPKFIATVHFILNEYSYSIIRHQKLSKNKVGESAASNV